MTVLGPTPHEDLCVERDGERPRLLVAGHGYSEDAGLRGPEQTLADFEGLLFSRDGTELYFATTAWVTSPAAHAVDLRTGATWFLVDGSVAATLDEGPYRGNLLVASRRIDEEHPVSSPAYRGRMQVWSVVSRKGKTLRVLPEDDAQRRRILER
jgi:hypothetical protein